MSGLESRWQTYHVSWLISTSKCPMSMERLPVSPENAARVADCLRGGGVVIIPTDTVYGIACAMDSESAFQRIYELKGRESGKPCALLIADAHTAESLWQRAPEEIWNMAREGWPGALTLVGPKSDKVPSRVTSGLPTVGLRIPNHEFALAVIRLLGQPLAATSANHSGSPSPRSLAEVPEEMMNLVDLVIDGGVILSKGASKVIEFTSDAPRVIRD